MEVERDLHIESEEWSVTAVTTTKGEIEVDLPCSDGVPVQHDEMRTNECLIATDENPGLYSLAIPMITTDVQT